MQDLLDLSHFVTRLKLAPEAGTGDPIAEGDRERARPLAEKLTMPVLARAWQMLLKGLEEVQVAPSPIQAAEMVLVRLAYVADLPAPAELVRSGRGEAVTAARAGQRRGNGSGHCVERLAGRRARLRRAAPRKPRLSRPSAGNALRAPCRASPPRRAAGSRRQLRPDAAKFCRGHRAVRQAGARRCSDRISGRMFIWFISNRGGSSSARPTARRAICQPPRPAAERMDRKPLADRRFRGGRRADPARAGGGAASGICGTRSTSHPLVQAVLETFPGATIAAVRERFRGGRAPDGDEPTSSGRPRRRSRYRRGRSMKNIGQLMKQAQEMQTKMAEMQAQLEAVEMTGAAGGGMVQLTLNGKGDLKKIKIDKSLLDPEEVEVLEDLIVAAFNDARQRSLPTPNRRCKS